MTPGAIFIMIKLSQKIYEAWYSGSFITAACKLNKVYKLQAVNSIHAMQNPSKLILFISWDYF